MIITRVRGRIDGNNYLATLKGYLPKYANTRMEAITLMLAQVTYWNKIKAHGNNK